jgi:nucleotide-binding universal stress UspA family protein
VWEAGKAFELMTPAPTITPAPIDIRAAIELDTAMFEAARQLAEQGATLARDAGLDAESLVVADDITVANTLIRVARERDAEAVVVGAHGHSGVRELVVGSTTRALIKSAPCLVVVRGPREDDDGDD